MSVLFVSDLTKTFKSPDGVPNRVVDVPEFAMAPGEQAALAGTSGSGKTTLLNLLAGILKADSGTIQVNGQEMSGQPQSRRDAIRARNIGYVFQTFNLLQGYTALENVALGMMFGVGADFGHARELLRRVGLSDRLRYKPSQLSVGQQQRVAIARALANRPKIVLADEPTGNLDPVNAREAIMLIRDICRENNAALLVVSHSPDILGQFERVEQLDRLNRAAATQEAPV